MLERLPIRWRLALTSAILTFAILCTFAFVVGELTQSRIKYDFHRSVATAADEFQSKLSLRRNLVTGATSLSIPESQLDDPEHGVIRIVTQTGETIWRSAAGPSLGNVVPPVTERVVNGYLVETRKVSVSSGGFAWLQFGRPISQLNETLTKVRLFLIFGVLGGTALALLGGVMIGRRAMLPIARLTDVADEIRRTRDPGRRISSPPANDEVADLARTLDRMLGALDESQSETEAALARQREFVADASHELRTPLTSVLANLELLADTLDGEQGDAARSALRSSHRMRRLVGDLLLLARADAQREAPSGPVDLGAILVDAAGELGAVAGDHDLSVEAEPVMVNGVRDDLHRMALNLMENAVRHTPPGTAIHARVTREGDRAVLSVEDGGPGIPSELRARVFERFVRGQGDRGGSFGLGLSIVRAVAEQHGGGVVLEDARPGARFVVRLPAGGEVPVPDHPPALAGRD